MKPVTTNTYSLSGERKNNMTHLLVPYSKDKAKVSLPSSFDISQIFSYTCWAPSMRASSPSMSAWSPSEGEAKVADEMLAYCWTFSTENYQSRKLKLFRFKFLVFSWPWSPFFLQFGRNQKTCLWKAVTVSPTVSPMTSTLAHPSPRPPTWKRLLRPCLQVKVIASSTIWGGVMEIVRTKQQQCISRKKLVFERQTWRTFISKVEATEVQTLLTRKQAIAKNDKRQGFYWTHIWSRRLSVPGPRKGSARWSSELCSID